MVDVIRCNIAGLLKTLDVHHQSNVVDKSCTKPLDIQRLFADYTLDSITEIAFGVKLNLIVDRQQGDGNGNGHEFQYAFDTAQKLICGRFLVPPFVWKIKRFFNVGTERELSHCLKVINSFAFSVIGDKDCAQRQKEGKHLDLASVFLDDSSSLSKTLGLTTSPKELRDILLNFILAGRDTSAQSLSWFFYEITCAPVSVLQEIRREIVEVRGEHVGDGDGFVPDYVQCSKLVYLDACVKESLRLHPPVPANMKRCVEDDVWPDGTKVPKGTDIVFSSYVMARQKRVWGENAAKFDPSRWLGDGDGISAYKFNSFHAGPRQCIGKHLAMLQLKMVTAALLNSFHFTLACARDEVTYDLALTLPIKDELPMYISKRDTNRDGVSVRA